MAETNTLELIDLLSPTNNLDRYLILRKKIRYTIEGRERHILITVPENHIVTRMRRAAGIVLREW